MAQEHTLKTIAGENPDVRLDVVVGADTDGTPLVELRRLSWGKGVGWYRQHTLQLDPSEAAALLQTLRGSRQQWQETPAPARGKVIPFPGLSQRACA
jgi:hypothetical protein